MLKRGGRGRDDGSQGRPHEEFVEFCALWTAGELTKDEQQELDAHLGQCEECRTTLREFEKTVDLAIPLLGPGLCDPAMPRREFADVRSGPVGDEREEIGRNNDRESKQDGVFGRASVDWNYVWVPLAAAVALIVALGIYSFQIGRRRGQESSLAASGVYGPKLEALEQQLSDAGHAREVLLGELSERDRAITDLRRQVEKQSTALRQIKLEESAFAESVKNRDTEIQHAAELQRQLSEKTEAAQMTIEKAQGDLDRLREARSRDESVAASLEAQIGDLNAQLREREETISKQDELLARDRDIRDLMGARDLYIAEVYDVARDGATQKPYGRVFYTKGKSLIFYAYDLDQQPGVKDASTFQAWGQDGPDRQQVLNLGIFYQDSVSKKRWVLKSDDPRALEQINAVFVTVEPHGGSHRPSGKPLLFASLKIEPNHP